MEEPNRTFTREELYDLVWSTPILKLSKRYELSDRGFAKICHRHQVPTPPRGYWAKLAAGVPVKKTPLREIKDAPLDLPPISSGKKHATARRVASSTVRAKAMPTVPKMKPALFEELEVKVEYVSGASVQGLSEGAERSVEFAPVTLDALIAHDVLLEKYPWLSGQILNRWRRKGLIRSFRGKGAVLYSRHELDRALDSEMRLEDQPEARQRPAPQSSSQRDQLISNVYRLEKSLRSLSKSGILEPKHVELLNQRRQEVGMGLITAEQPPPPQPKERARKKPAP